MTTLHQLHEMGQSTWLNTLRRSFIQSGELRTQIEQGIQGLTVNAALFQKTIIAATDYDQAIRQETAAGTPARHMRDSLMAVDAQMAADQLHWIFEETNGRDGFVSQELDPALTVNATKTAAEVRHLAALSDRNNIMVEIPATPAGLEAVTALIGDAQSINITHIFAVDTYERAAQAYIAGLEYLFDTHSMWRITPKAVASFSVSAIDSAVDDILLQMGRPDLQGKTAVALAKRLYERFHQIFSGPRWEKLARRGALPLRPKWTRTTPRSFTYRDTYYIEALIGPGTVTTFSPATLNAFLDHGTVAPTLTQGVEQAHAHLAQLADLGIDLDAITGQLQRQHLRASEKQFEAGIHAISRKREALESDWHRLETDLGSYEAGVEAALDEIDQAEIIARIWAQDESLWPAAAAGTAPPLGWLHLTAVMEENEARLRQLAQSVLEEGFTQMVFVGPGSLCLGAEVMHATFGKPAQPPYMPYPYPELFTADLAHLPDETLEEKLDLKRTLFLVAAQAKDAVNGMFGFNHFYNQMVEAVGREKAGTHFVVLTDPGSLLVEVAQQHRLRHVFINDPHLSPLYTPLSFFGLVPAALVGADLATLLGRAAAAAVNTQTSFAEMLPDNLGASLGLALAELAAHGRPQVALLPSLALRPLARWVTHLLRQGSGGRLQPAVAASADEALAADLLVQLRLPGDAQYDTAVQTHRDAGKPAVVLHLQDLYDVGGQLFLWQMATAVAGHRLHVNPFAPVTPVPATAA